MAVTGFCKKIIQTITVVFTVLLVCMPLVMHVLIDVCGFMIMDSDLFLQNLVFSFTCFAGIITSWENRQLSLGSFVEHLPKRVHTVVTIFRDTVSLAMLTALFFASLLLMGQAFTPDDKVIGIPVAVIFGSLPFMYLVITGSQVYVQNKASAVVGLVLGLFVSSGSIAGLIYINAGSVPSFLDIMMQTWISFSSAALWPLVILFIFLALIGAPLFIILSGIGFIAFSQGGGYVEQLSQEFYNILIDKTVAAIPLFTLAGYFLASGSAGKRLVDFIHSAVGWIRGGPALAVVLVLTLFTTFTGASGVTILALGGLLSLILQGNGYTEDDSCALITSCGSIGLLFPPSMAIILYGTTNYFSVDVYDLFKGALLPGVLLAISMFAMGFIKDKNTVRKKFNPAVFHSSVKQASFELLLPVLIIVAYFSGVLSLTETAAFAALYAFVLECFIRRDFSLRKSVGIILKAVPVVGGVLIILGSARGLAYYLIDAGIPELLTAAVTSFVHSKYLFLILLNILLLFVGCIMDIFSATLVVSPLIIPIAESFGLDPVHIGVIFLTNLALGFLTPPVGMDLFIASYTFNKPVMQICKKVLPFLAIQFAILMLVTYVPWFSLVFVR